MTWPTIFANLAGGNQPLSLFDGMFNQVAQMVAIPCTAAGTNSYTLSPIGTAPTITGYQNFSSFRFVAPNTSTGLVSAQFQALPNLPCYLSDGVTQAGSGTIVVNQEYVLVFAQFLNGGLGGFFLEAASVPAVPPTAGAAISNLFVATNAGGNPNKQIICHADELVLNNPAGAAARFLNFNNTADATTTGANGLDTGVLANSSQYCVWAIGTATAAFALLSLSFSNPTMPPGLTFKRRIGCAITDGSANFLRFQAFNGRQQYVVGGNPANTIVSANGVQGTYSVTSPTLITVGVGGLVSPSAGAVFLAAATSWKGGAAANILVAPDTNWGGTNNGPQGSNGNVYPIWNAGLSMGSMMEMTLEVGLGNGPAVASSAAGFAVTVLGYQDNL